MGVVEVEAVAVDEHVHPRRVAAPHLQAVEGSQRDLDRVVGVEGGRPRARPGQRGRRPGRRQPVAPHRPHRVLEGDEGPVGGLDAHQFVPVGQGQAAGVDILVEAGDAAVDLPRQQLQTGGGLGIGDQCPHARRAAERTIDRGDLLDRGVQPAQRVGVLQPRQRPLQPGLQLGQIRGDPFGGTTDHGHDPAHAPPGYLSGFTGQRPVDPDKNAGPH